MKNLFFVATFLFVNSALATPQVTPATPLPDAQVKLLTCDFRESMSISFGFSSVYTFTGPITVADPDAQDPFFEVNGLIKVTIDDTASTNFAAKHIADSTATMNNHPWGNKVMLDITSTKTAGPEAFRITVFTGALNNGTYEAYKINSLTGNGLVGTCTALDPRLILN